jgi:hypothetical protein
MLAEATYTKNVTFAGAQVCESKKGKSYGIPRSAIMIYVHACIYLHLQLRVS